MKSKRFSLVKVLSIILLISTMAGAVGALAWATKGFRDKNFENVLKIKENQNLGGDTSSEKKVEEKEKTIEIANGATVIDYKNNLDVNAMGAKTERNYIIYKEVVKSEGATPQEEGKEVYIKFSAYPAKSVDMLQAKLFSKETGNALMSDGTSVNDYVEIDKEEFPNNEKLKVVYKKPFEEYIVLNVTTGDKNVEILIGCKGNLVQGKNDYIDELEIGNVEVSLIPGESIINIEGKKIKQALRERGYVLGTEKVFEEEEIGIEIRPYTERECDEKAPKKFAEILYDINLKNRKANIGDYYKGDIPVIKFLPKYGLISERNKFINMMKEQEDWSVGNYVEGVGVVVNTTPKYKRLKNNNSETFLEELKELYKGYLENDITEDDIKKIAVWNYYAGMFYCDAKAFDTVRRYIITQMNSEGWTSLNNIVLFEFRVVYNGIKLKIKEPKKLKGYKNEVWGIETDHPDRVIYE